MIAAAFLEDFVRSARYGVGIIESVCGSVAFLHRPRGLW
jgi:hypothetical protein